MIKLASRRLCTGCAACASICSRGAIEMKEDGEGFLYPTIDELKCLECGLCARVCPALNLKEKRFPIKCFAAMSEDGLLREGSSSGGVFSELAIPVIRSNGVVFGCELDNKTFRARHVKVSTESGLASLRKSKYIQSDVGFVFRDVRNEVVGGRLVLFSGTPCQIAGLRSFLGKDYPNLILVGIICHGTPSYKLLGHFIACKERKIKSKFATFDFRSKLTGWKNFCIRCADDCGIDRYYEKQSSNSYMRLFNGNVAFRESCYNCPSRQGRAPADLLIGDFWGVELLCPEMDDLKGTSIVLAYSEKGVAAITSSALTVKTVSFGDAIKYNNNVQNDERRKVFRNVTYLLLSRLSFDKVALIYQMTTIGYWKRVPYLLYRPFKPFLVRVGLKRESR